MNDCIDSMALKDEDLLRHILDGEPLPVAAQLHLDQCATCQQRLASYSFTNRHLLIQLYRNQCPSSTQLGFYCAGLLPFDKVLSIASHLKICPLCAEEAMATRRYLASDLFPESMASSSSRATLQRIVASFVPRQAQLVTRSAPHEPTKQSWPCQYHADNVNLSLHLSRDSRGDYMLLGLFTSTDSEEKLEVFAGTKVELYYVEDAALPDRNGNESVDHLAPFQCSQVDDLGNVVFNAVPTGSYLIIVYLPETEMVVEHLTIEDS